MITTRERLLTAGLSLIAERGFKATTVGDIEVAAGLVPRSGGLYKHFPSKHALIEAGIKTRIERVDSLASVVGFFADPPSSNADRRKLLITTGQVILDELDAESEIARIIDRDGDRFPEFREAMHNHMVEPGFAFTEEALRLWISSYEGTPAQKDRLDALDLPAISAVVLGSLVNLRRHEWMFGTPVHGIDDTRFLASWADMTLLLFPEDNQ